MDTGIFSEIGREDMLFGPFVDGSLCLSYSGMLMVSAKHDAPSQNQYG